MMDENEILAFIENELKTNDVVLFIKGSASSPQCGFSGMVVAIMNKLGVNYQDINVLSNEHLRQQIKQYSQWPTIPQIYIKGEFIGGCDILKEMYQSGELLELLKQKQIVKA